MDVQRNSLTCYVPGVALVELLVIPIFFSLGYISLKTLNKPELLGKSVTSKSFRCIFRDDPAA